MTAAQDGTNATRPTEQATRNVGKRRHLASGAASVMHTIAHASTHTVI
ncbi:MAG: hypothetical protein U1E05_07980 [Patescibacteria group bacterium]|nr:hypothetical protein [Patescibacteria group bacterium]